MIFLRESADSAPAPPWPACRSLHRPLGTVTTKARWALINGDRMRMFARRVLDLAAPAAPAVDAETIEDAERFRAMANAALTDDEVFGRALDQHPDMGGDATIDDVRAMFDAARAAQAKEGGE